jgi:hypothetical protein
MNDSIINNYHKTNKKTDLIFCLRDQSSEKLDICICTCGQMHPPAFKEEKPGPDTRADEKLT